MTQGSPGKLIFTFSMPLMVGNVFQQLYTVVDAMVVGQILGVAAMAALGAADWMNWMMLAIVQGLAQGFSIRMAQEFGAGDFRQLRKTVGNAVVLAIVSSLALTVVGQMMVEKVLRLLQTPDAIFGDALIYLRIMYGGIPAVMAFNLLASILRALGDGKTPLYAMMIASCTNIALDLLFVGGFHTGISGAAIATVIAQCCSAVFCFFRIRRIEVLCLEKSDFMPKTGLCKNLLRLGSPMALQNAIIAIGGMIVQSVVNGFGVAFIAGFTATNKLYGVLEIAATSYGYAMTTYTGQNIGAGKWERIRKGIRSSLFIAMITSFVIMTIMIFAGKGILRGFISGDNADATATMTVAYHYLVIMSVTLPILYILHVVRSCIQGMGNTVLPMVSGMAEFVMRTAIAFFLPRWIGEEGVLYAELGAWLGADVILVASYFYLIHKRMPKKKRQGFADKFTM